MIAFIKYIVSKPCPEVKRAEAIDRNARQMPCICNINTCSVDANGADVVVAELLHLPFHDNAGDDSNDACSVGNNHTLYNGDANSVALGAHNSHDASHGDGNSAGCAQDLSKK